MKTEYFTLNPTMKILVVFGTVIVAFVIMFLLLTSFCDWHAGSCVMLDNILPNLISVGLLSSFVIPSAWACTLTEEGAKKFELLCPTRKLESDCTCNINGVNVDVLSVVTALSYTDVIATIGIIIGGIVMVSVLYIRRRRSRWESQDDN